MRRAVLFDLFNTLVPGGADGLRERVLRRMAEVLGVDPDAYLRICNDTLPERLAGGMGDPMTMVGTLARRVGGRPSAEQVARAAAPRREMIGGLLAAVPETTLSPPGRAGAAGRLGGLGSNSGMGDPMTMVGTLARRVGGRPSAEQVARAAALRREMIDGLLAAVPETTLSTLDRVRAAGWLVGLVSNTTRDDPDRFRRSRLAGRFDATVFSSELRAGKPDPKIFLTACELLDVPPHACVYVGDGGDDELAAAAALGMRTIRTVEHADTVPGWRGPTVRTLAELPPLLPGPHPVSGRPG